MEEALIGGGVYSYTSIRGIIENELLEMSVVSLMVVRVLLLR